jgi:hypothetical protein
VQVLDFIDGGQVQVWQLSARYVQCNQVYTQELEKVGFSRDQAEASVRLLIDVMNENFSTKSDLKELELALRADFKQSEAANRADFRESEAAIKASIKEWESSLRADFVQSDNILRTELKETESSLRAEIKNVEVSVNTLEVSLRSEMRELENRMTIKLGSMMVVAIGVTATLVKLF